MNEISSIQSELRHGAIEILPRIPSSSFNDRGNTSGHDSLMVNASESIIRLEQRGCGLESKLWIRVVAEARGVLQSIKRALEVEQFGSDRATRLEAVRDRLQTILADLPRTW